MYNKVTTSRAHPHKESPRIFPILSGLVVARLACATEL